MNTETALAKYKDHLSDREKEEIVEYTFIYYAGDKATNKKRRTKVGYELNGGYDDPQGYYHAVIGDHIAFRYEILGSLGSGACGQVIKAYDHKHNEKVAIKLIRNVPLFKELAQQEIKVGKVLSKVDASNDYCVVHLLNHFSFRHHPCMVFELLGLNLFELMRSHDFKGLSEDVVREFASEMLMSLLILRKNQIVHCDIKPQNIMLFNRHCNCTELTLLPDDRQKCALGSPPLEQNGHSCPDEGKTLTPEPCACGAGINGDHPVVHPDNVLSTLAEIGCEHHLKLIDFGCSAKSGHCRYPYIQSRYYRAPEVILGCGYSCPIDMWSFACVISELLTGKPLFPGENETDQLVLIIEMFGIPPKDALTRAKRYKSYFDQDGYPKYCAKQLKPDGTVTLDAGVSPSGKPRAAPGSRSLRETLGPSISDDLIDFLAGCFDLNPQSRLTPMQALDHAWMQERMLPFMRKRAFTR